MQGEQNVKNLFRRGCLLVLSTENSVPFVVTFQGRDKWMMGRWTGEILNPRGNVQRLGSFDWLIGEVTLLSA